MRKEVISLVGFIASVSAYDLWIARSFNTTMYSFMLNETNNSFPVEQQWPPYYQGQYVFTFDERLNCTNDGFLNVAKCDAAPVVYQYGSCYDASYASDNYNTRRDAWIEQYVNRTSNYWNYWKPGQSYEYYISVPNWGWESYNVSYMRYGWENSGAQNKTYLYIRMDNNAIVFSENVITTGFGSGQVNTSYVNYFPGGIPTYVNLYSSASFENYLPKPVCQWAYDRYPQLRGKNETRKSTDEVIIANYVDNVMRTYGDGESMSLDEFTRYLRDVSDEFNNPDNDFHAQTLAVQIMWLIDANKNRKIDREELETFLEGMTLVE